METKTPFHILIVEPLKTILGETLQHVFYRILVLEEPHFNADAPNLIGPVAVNLVFEHHTLEVFPSWEKALRDGNAFSIHTALLPERVSSNTMDSDESFCWVNVDLSIDWGYAFSQTLESVEVTGIGASPQAIRFIFSSMATIISIGYSGDPNPDNPVLVGDGHEILIFSDEQWQKAKRTLLTPWTKLWESRNL